MNVISTEDYRRAFARYIRTGTPIRLSFKSGRPTPQYVWRTRGDKRVRAEHAANEGRLFSWDDPPATSHPGEGRNCRCEAVPYVQGETEYAGHEITGSLASSYDKWAIVDFIRHFYTGEGRGVTLSEIGHLRDIVEQYAYHDDGMGAHRRLTEDIVAGARAQGSGPLAFSFGRSYEFEHVQLPESYPHGGAVVRGFFVGHIVPRGRFLSIEGELHFQFRDVFTDPLTIRERLASGRQAGQAQVARYVDAYREVAELIGIAAPGPVQPREVEPDDVPEWLFQLTEVYGTAYEVNDRWESTFRAEVLRAPAMSIY